MDGDDDLVVGPFHVAFLLHDLDGTSFGVVAPPRHRREIRSSLAREQGQGEGRPFAGAEWPVLLKRGDFQVRPRVVSAFAEASYRRGRIVVAPLVLDGEAHKHSQRLQNGGVRTNARSFADILARCGVPCARHNVEDGKRRAFVSNSCLPTRRCLEAVDWLRREYFPSLRAEDLFAESVEPQLLAALPDPAQRAA